VADEGVCDGVCVAADKDEDGSAGRERTSATWDTWLSALGVVTGIQAGECGTESGRLTGGLRKARLPVSVCYSLPQRFRNSAISSIR